MRSFSRLICAFAIAAAPTAFAAAANATPRTINDCETIQAPDAYNQCLALFGPIARGHAKTANVEEPGLSGKTDAEPAQAEAEAGRARTAHASGHEKKRRGYSRGGHRHRVADAHRGHVKAMRFSVVSGHSRIH